MSQTFPEPTPEQIEAERDVLAQEVADWSGPSEFDLGAVIVRRRDWPPPWPALVIMVVIGLPVFLITSQPWWSNLVLYLAVVVVIGLFLVVTGRENEIVVRERAVVLRRRRTATRVLPLWSVDPSRLRYHESAPAMQRRLYGDDILFTTLSGTFRMAIYARTAISVEGVDLLLDRGEPEDRAHFSAGPPLAWQRFVRVGGEGWGVFGDPTDYGLTPYVVSTRRPHEILSAIEQAMVSIGRASARGLADWAVAHPVREDRTHPLTEVEVYGRNGSAYPWFHGPSQQHLAR